MFHIILDTYWRNSVPVCVKFFFYYHFAHFCQTATTSILKTQFCFKQWNIKMWNVLKCSLSLRLRTFTVTTVVSLSIFYIFLVQKEHIYRYQWQLLSWKKWSFKATAIEGLRSYTMSLDREEQRPIKYHHGNRHREPSQIGLLRLQPRLDKTQLSNCFFFSLHVWTP